jgi:mannose-6-phosphate isomerase-like protein (cupin superfamily)
MIEEIRGRHAILAIIIRANYTAPGIHFFTPPEFSQQLAYMRHPAGKEIEPHCHNPIPREVHLTQEVLFIRRGRVRVDLYESDQSYVCSHELSTGDAILLASGGHGFEVLEELEMFEVKQGPYAGQEEKTRFQSAAVVRVATA